MRCTPRGSKSTSAASSWRIRSNPSARTTSRSSCTRTSPRTSRSKSSPWVWRSWKKRRLPPPRPPNSRRPSMQFVDGPPGGPDAWREVWQQDRRFRPRPSKWDFFLRFVRRLVNRVSEAEAERQRNFNLALLDLVADLRRDVATVRDDLKRDLVAVQLDVRQADEALAAEVARLRELIPVAAKRNDAL